MSHNNKYHYEAKQRVYDDFVTYIHNRYPKIAVCDFSDMPHAGVTHMILPLDNVTKADQALYTYVSKFSEGTSLEATENIKTGAPTYIANVPYVAKSKSSKKKSSSVFYGTDSGDAPPNTLTPILLLVAILVLVIVAVIKTDATQWRAIAFWN